MFSVGLGVILAALGPANEPTGPDLRVDVPAAVVPQALPVGAAVADDRPRPLPATQPVSQKAEQLAAPQRGHVTEEPACDHEHERSCGRARSWSIYADWLYMIPRGQSIPFGQIRDGVGPLSVPAGGVGSIDPDYSSGVRFGGGFAIGELAELRAGFTYYDNKSSGSLAVPEGQPFVIQSLTVFPTTENAAADSLTASAESDLRLFIADVDFRHELAASDCFNLNFILGGRFAHLEQGFDAEYTILGTTNVSTDVDFDGGGPRVGLDGAYGKNVFVFARGTASFLVGHFGANYLQQNVFGGTQAQTDLSDDRVVTVLDFESGIGWKSQGGRLSLSAGYLASCWLNSMTTASWIEGVRGSNFTTNGDNLRDNLTFDGFFLRAELRY